MKWKKLGRIFHIENHSNWIFSHASVPIAELVEENIFRIYFSSRNKNDESSIGYILFDINTLSVKEISKKPVLEKGKIGTFDDSGVMGSCIVNLNSKKYLYYIGWNLGVTVPFRNSIGLAVSEDGGNSFKRVYEGPIIDRSKEEPYFTASSCVLIDDNRFKIWYLSCTGWEKRDNRVFHRYHIKYAESNDGINWERKQIVAIDYKDRYEYAISVPRVIKENGIYKMWFSSRATQSIPTYRIRYAESKDGINWVRKDEEAGIDISEEGWDSEMICYPFVFDHNGKRYMLYNGNGYGKSGFGLAVLEQE